MIETKFSGHDKILGDTKKFGALPPNANPWQRACA